MPRQRTRYERNGLSTIREERGLKAGYVAKKIGVTISTISRWESLGPAKPSQMGINSLSHFYGLPVAAIEEAIANARLQA